MNNKMEKSETKFINFFIRKKDYKELSNMANIPVEITMNNESFSFKTGEHAFHFCKYYHIYIKEEDLNKKQKLKNYAMKFTLNGEFNKEPVKDIKKLGGKKHGFILSMVQQKLWNQVAEDYQKQICKWKFDNYEKIRKLLKETGNKILIHPTRGNLENNVWAGRWDKTKQQLSGENKLGNIWMELRNDLFIVY